MTTAIKTIDVGSICGGKDSTAMWLLAKKRGIDLQPIFADTGHEHPMTYEYLDYLESELGPINRVKADFTERIAKKRQYVIDHWPRKLMQDVPEHLDDDGNVVPFQKGMTVDEASAVVERALSVLYPTGNSFLDLCIWKGRFPSTKARFCTQFLKVDVIFDQVYTPNMDFGNKIVSWQGIRREESLARRNLPEWEETPDGYTIYRPLIDLTVDDVFAIHREMGRTEPTL